MNNNKVINLEEKQEPNVFGERVPSRRNRDSGGGGGNMSEYVTKEEFNSAVKEITHSIELNQRETNAKLDLISQSIRHNESLIEEKLGRQNDSILRTDGKVNWIVGLVVGSIIIPIFFTLFWN